MQEEDCRIASPSSSSPMVSFCPSFNSYYSAKLVDVADRVSQDQQRLQQDEEEDFEFVCVARDDPEASELFFDGQIRQVFPVFNQDLLLNNDHEHDHNQPLKNLFLDQGPPSSSSSEEDELEGIPEETYCVWSPKKKSPVGSSPNRWQKSNSTGSSSSSSASKGWLKFRDLLKRSNSDSGGASFAFLHKTKTNCSSPDLKAKQVGCDQVKATGKVKVVSAHEAFYVKNRAMKQGDMKKSFLPYRQDLLGFFANNFTSLGKSFPPF